MQESYKKKLEGIINEFSSFLENEYSSRFKNLTSKEDRHLFFLANLLVRLKHILEEIKEEHKILIHPALRKKQSNVEAEVAEVRN